MFAALLTLSAIHIPTHPRVPLTVVLSPQQHPDVWAHRRACPDLASALHPDRASSSPFVHFSGPAGVRVWRRLLWKLIHRRRTHFLTVTPSQSSKTHMCMQVHAHSCKQTRNLATVLPEYGVGVMHSAGAEMRMLIMTSP